MSKDYIRKARLAQFAGHTLMVVMLFVLPDMLMAIGRERAGVMHYMRPATYILIFYINYIFLINHFIFRKRKLWQYLLINVALCALTMYLASIMIDFMHSAPHAPQAVPGVPQPPHQNAMPPRPHLNPYEGLSFMLRDVIMQFFTIALAVALKLASNWRQWDERTKQIEASQREMELKNLREQLNPHCLFNTLNNIYALIAISEQKAQNAVHQLSQLLRYVLYDNQNEMVPVEDELKFMRNYIALMTLRMPPTVELKVDIDESQGSGLKIAPLLFISLIENAFKHGARADKPSFIHISVAVVGGTVACDVRNSLFPPASDDRRSSGIGLANLRKRLQILYPDSHSFNVETNNDTYHSSLKIIL